MELFRRALEGNEAKLVNELDVDSGLWTELLSRKVLIRRQLESCNSEVSWSLLLIKLNS